MKTNNDPTEIEEEVQEAKFNFALSSLQRIHELLQSITTLAKNPEVSGADLQVLKRRLIKQLLVQSIVLLHKDDSKKIIEKVEGIKLKINTHGFVVYSLELDNKLDDCVMDIQISMQKHGKFFIQDKEDKEAL